MARQDVEIPTADGTMDAQLYRPEGAGPWPAVLLLTDAGGTRPAFESMAQRLSNEGYVVLLPHVYYREGRAPLPNMQGSFQRDEAFRKRILGLIATLPPERVRMDAAASLDFLARQPSVVGKAGVVGYCMSGGMAVHIAATFPERVAAAASFHGGRLATDAPESPHRVVGQVRGELYFGHADQDGSMPADAIARLEAALKEAGVKHRSELYVGAHHGFAVEGSEAYDADAAAQHWTRMLELWGRTLRA
ncbi:dienelactone hydrolase family protein [Melittangium boletus]|uniref:dienelactone hydrolase family protein n=1 Tax=Melittangium boletus TaxID=83453 RepID=UPI003DA6768D